MGTREPFVISGPGEYEVGGIFIKGFGTETTYADENLPATAYRSKEAVGRGQAGKINTVFSVMFEGINLCFLGSLASSDALSREVKEGLGEIDVLFAPIGGGDMLSASDAYKLTLAVDAKVVIPMDYEHTKGALRRLLKKAARMRRQWKSLHSKGRTLMEKRCSGGANISLIHPPKLLTITLF